MGRSWQTRGQLQACRARLACCVLGRFLVMLCPCHRRSWWMAALVLAACSLSPVDDLPSGGTSSDTGGSTEEPGAGGNDQGEPGSVAGGTSASGGQSAGIGGAVGDGGLGDAGQGGEGPP